jgi:hypothetical protein
MDHGPIAGELLRAGRTIALRSGPPAPRAAGRVRSKEGLKCLRIVALEPSWLAYSRSFC